MYSKSHTMGEGVKPNNIDIVSWARPYGPEKCHFNKYKIVIISKIKVISNNNL
jgi:hypothetical protein